ncbi:MAG: four-carbon acid sugar kinase family protein [Candidatus Anaerobiospirillum merdipullorum]|uniref:Four-carbon acid sugar kinase family protein n=1 Tax=Candidatus Anaerobiospirillum merdipullorum TaxID=2838450 RepID=A0A9E2KN46_9GAMM|nr:four-carbon acid sugar kinase family protein [Candidatus Anaerobiospirillum merdipullorum]
MVQCVVISDEVTGGSSVGALLEKNQSSVCALISSQALKEPAINDFDCLVYSTNSRNLTPEQSYQLVFSAARLLRKPDVKIYAKRIDPAMRGNTCAETQAMLDALGDSDRVAIVVPAFPALHRSNVGGYILLDGRPVQKTIIGQEDLQPQASGRVADLFSEKFRYSTKALHLKELMHGQAYLAKCFQDLAAQGVRAIVLDCTSQEDINMIADAVLASGIKFLAVDPGPFTATLARKAMRERVSTVRHPRIFGLVGGSNPLISAQVELLRLNENVHLVPVKNLELLQDDQHRASEIERVVNEIVLNAADFNASFAISDFLGASSQQLDLFQTTLANTNRTRNEAIDIISAAYGEIAKQVLSRCLDFKAVYSTGAEYTVAVCRELKAYGLRLKGQVLPLTAFGEILGGDFDGLKYVTSASSATDTTTIVDAIQYLKRKLEI